MSEYATYTRFYAPEEAEFLITLLQQNNIPYKLDHEVNLQPFVQKRFGVLPSEIKVNP